MPLEDPTKTKAPWLLPAEDWEELEDEWGPHPDLSLVLGGENDVVPDEMLSEIRAVLKKMPPTKIRRTCSRIMNLIKLNCSDELDGRPLRSVAQLIVDEAKHNAIKAPVYAELCRVMALKYTKLYSLNLTGFPVTTEGIRDAHGNLLMNDQRFQEYLINYCEEEWERDCNLVCPIDPAFSLEDRRTILGDTSQLDVLKTKEKKEIHLPSHISLPKFIGELYKHHMLSKGAIDNFVRRLLPSDGVPGDSKIDRLCSLLQTVGANLDQSSEGRDMMDAYLAHIERILKVSDLNSNARLLLQSIIQQRVANWDPCNLDLRISHALQLQEASNAHDAVRNSALEALEQFLARQQLTESTQIPKDEFSNLDYLPPIDDPTALQISPQPMELAWGPHDVSNIRETIQRDLTWEQPKWIFSSYAPTRKCPRRLFGGPICEKGPVREQSMEEMRVLHYAFAAKGQENYAISEAEQFWQMCIHQTMEVLKDLDGTVKYLEDGDGEHPNHTGSTEGSVVPSVPSVQKGQICIHQSDEALNDLDGTLKSFADGNSEHPNDISSTEGSVPVSVYQRPASVQTEVIPSKTGLNASIWSNTNDSTTSLPETTNVYSHQKPPVKAKTPQGIYPSSTENKKHDYEQTRQVDNTLEVKLKSRSSKPPSTSTVNNKPPRARSTSRAVTEHSTSKYHRWAGETSNEESDRWLREVEDAVLSWLPMLQENDQVRVAILDTGIDRKHPYFKKPHRFEKYGRPDSRIKECMSFLPGEKRGDKDVNGHGTHVASLVLRLAPNAEVYVARVIDDDCEVSHPEAVAEAIKHATDKENGWGVHIISMSFGWPKEYPCVTAAIRAAKRENVLLFAAACNQGFNDDNPVRYPARSGDVFAVFSYDVHGTREIYNPPSNDGFGTLGAEVWGPWTRHGHDQTKHYAYQWGTSVATPILAASAALALQYIWQKKPNGPLTFTPKDGVKIKVRNIEGLEGNDGMKKLLQLMTRPENPLWVKPNFWLKNSEDAKEELFKILKRNFWFPQQIVG